MKITLVGPGIMPIPPTGWGAVEILIWDTKLALEELGHEVQIVNTKDYRQIINEINAFVPDFVHVHYDEFINLCPYIQYPSAITSHFGYLERPQMFNGYANVANQFASIKQCLIFLKRIFLLLQTELILINLKSQNLQNTQTDQSILQRLIIENVNIYSSLLIVFGLLEILLIVDLILTRTIWVNGLKKLYTMNSPIMVTLFFYLMGRHIH
jgi:hypothetical protein